MGGWWFGRADRTKSNAEPAGPTVTPRQPHSNAKTRPRHRHGRQTGFSLSLPLTPSPLVRVPPPPNNTMEHGGGAGSGSNLLSPPELTPLEQEVLDEYERLAHNMKQVRKPRSTPCRRLCLTRAEAGHGARRAGLAARDRDPRRPARAGAQDEPGLYPAQGERLQHCAAAGD